MFVCNTCRIRKQGVTHQMNNGYKDLSESDTYIPTALLGQF